MKLKNVVAILSISTLLASCGKDAVNNESGTSSNTKPLVTEKTTEKNISDDSNLVIEESNLADLSENNNVEIQALSTAAGLAVGASALIAGAHLENILKGMVSATNGLEKRLFQSYLNDTKKERQLIEAIDKRIALFKANHEKIEDVQQGIKSRINELQTLQNEDKKVLEQIFQEQADNMGGTISQTQEKIQSLKEEARKLAKEIEEKKPNFAVNEEAAKTFDKKSSQLKQAELRIVDDMNSLEILKSEGASANKIASMQKQLERNTAQRDRLAKQVPVALDTGVAVERLERIQSEIKIETEFLEIAKKEQIESIANRNAVEKNNQRTKDILDSKMFDREARLKYLREIREENLERLNKSATSRQFAIDLHKKARAMTEARLFTINKSIMTSTKGKAVRLLQKVRPQLLNVSTHTNLPDVKLGLMAGGIVVVTVGVLETIEIYNLLGERIDSVSSVK